MEEGKLELGWDFSKSNDLDKYINKIFIEKGLKKLYKSEDHISHQEEIINKIQKSEININEFIDEYPCYNTRWRFYLKGKGCRLTSILINSFLILYDFLTNTPDIFSHANLKVQVFILSIIIVNINKSADYLTFNMPTKEFTALINILKKFNTTGILNEFITHIEGKNLLKPKKNAEFLELPGKEVERFAFPLWEYKPCYLPKGVRELDDFSPQSHVPQLKTIFENIDSLKNVDLTCDTIGYGGGYYEKYIKYKTKYINLKKIHK